MRQRFFGAACAVVIALAGIANRAYAGDPIAVCIGKEGSLRLGETSQPCKPGEQKTLFTEWEPEAEDPPEGEDPSEIAMNKKIEALSQRVGAVENRKATPDKTEAVNVESLMKRVAALENKKKITAPFEVVSRSGGVILRVAEKVSTGSGQGAQVTIGAGAAGNYALRIHKNGGPLIAGLGQSLTGAGIVLVTNPAGEVTAIMDGHDKKVSIFDGGHAAASLSADNGGTVAVYVGAQPVAYLTRSSHGGGGNLTLSTTGGFGVFSAGAASDGGGEACLNRVTGGGKERNVCLGVELPSMGLGK